NTFSAMGWQGGEAILRFQPGPVFSALNADYFVPHDWVALDTGDVDIGGSAPVLIDVQGATPSQLVVSLGKNGKVYLLDRQSLGGVSTTANGDGLFNLGVASGEIINAAASFCDSARSPERQARHRDADADGGATSGASAG